MGERLRRVGIVTLLVLPPVLAFLYINLFGVNVVFADEFAIVPLIEKLYGGTLTLGDLLSAHNEHRILFPRILTLLLAHFTHYNTVALMYASWVLAGVTLLLLFGMYRREFGLLPVAAFGFVPVSWLLFSFRQHESMLWGFEIQMYLCAAGFVASIYLLERGKTWGFVAAIGAGFIATFSCANGLLVWPVGVLYIAISTRGKRVPRMILWGLAGAIFFWMYFFLDETLAAGRLRGAGVLSEPFVRLVFFILNIGSPLAFVKSSAIGMGTALGVCLAIVLACSFRRGFPREGAAWLALMLFSLGSSVLFMLGRIAHGLSGALASRYVPFTVLGVIGAYLAVLQFQHQQGAQDEKRRLYWAAFRGAILAIIVVGLVSGYASGLVRGMEIRSERERLAEYLIDYEHATDENLRRLSPNAGKVREGARFLQEHGLNVFHE